MTIRWVEWDSDQNVCQLEARCSVSQVAAGTCTHRSIASRAAGCCLACNWSILYQQLPPSTAWFKACCLMSWDLWLQTCRADAAYPSLQSILHEGPACGRMMPETACCPLFD